MVQIPFEVLPTSNLPKINSNTVHHFGVSANVTIGIGLAISGGRMWDDNGDYRYFVTIGASLGGDMTAGLEYGRYYPIPGESITINDIRGAGHNTNIGVYYFDLGWGGNTDGYGNPGDALNTKFRSWTIGASGGLPVGATKVYEQAILFGGPSVP